MLHPPPTPAQKHTHNMDGEGDRHALTHTEGDRHARTHTCPPVPMENVTHTHTHTVPIEKVIERIQIKEIPVVETEERVVEVCVPPHVVTTPSHPRERKHVDAENARRRLAGRW